MSKLHNTSTSPFSSDVVLDPSTSMKNWIYSQPLIFDAKTLKGETVLLLMLQRKKTDPVVAQCTAMPYVCQQL